MVNTQNLKPDQIEFQSSDEESQNYKKQKVAEKLSKPKQRKVQASTLQKTPAPVNIYEEDLKISINDDT